MFGDIGTSPLYTLQECLTGPHGVPVTPENVTGILSLILWAITLVVTVKYLAFLMRADNQGEGGIMALLALVPSQFRVGTPGKVGWVSALVIVGAALLFGDGIITPAISVLSAVEGLGVATEALKPTVVPITMAILVALFAVQRRGTGALGTFFGPIMLVWFITIGVLGIVQISKNHSVLAALSPLPGIRFFQNHGFHAVRALGSVVLAVTGGEALYADMGHFGAKSIRAGWMVLVYPALILCYLGQGALVLADPSLATNLFYSLVPKGPMIYPLVGLAAMATVIASQALISGVFSLTHQAIQLGYFPRVEVSHTSREAEGQIYVPAMNTLLAVSCLALVLIFRESSKLAAAYGLAVSGTMLITAVVFWVVTRHTWKWSGLASAATLIFFLSFDIPFVFANALKFFDGGYLPFLVGLGFTIVMFSWKIGRGLLGEYFASQSPPLEEFLAEIEKTSPRRAEGVTVFMASLSRGTPPVLTRLMRRLHVVYETMILLTITFDHVPEVADEGRVTVEHVGQGLWRVVARFGFDEQPNVPAILARVFPEIAPGQSPDGVLYVLGRETVVPGDKGKMHPFWEHVFAWLSRNARSATAYFGIPPERVIELGIQVDLLTKTGRPPEGSRPAGAASRVPNDDFLTTSTMP